MSWMTPRNSLKFHGDFGGPQLPSAPPASAPERSRRHPPAVQTGFGNTRTVLDFGHFANGTWVTDLVSVNRQTTPSSPAPLPFSYGHPSEPSRDLFLRHPWVIGSGRDFDPWPGDLLTGSVRVVSDLPIGEIAPALATTEPPGGRGRGQPTTPQSASSSRCAVQEGRNHDGRRAPQPGIESGPAAVRIEERGRVARRRDFPLEANGQTAWFIDQTFPSADTSDFVGSVRCSAPGEGLFSAVAMKLDAVNRIFTTLPVVPVPEMPSRE